MNEEGMSALFLWSRKYAISLLRFESLLLLVLVLYLSVASLFSTVTAPAALAAEIIFATLGAIGLFACSNGFSRNKSYGRAPALLANLIALGVAYFMFGGHLYFVAVPLSILATITAFAVTLGYRE